MKISYKQLNYKLFLENLPNSLKKTNLGYGEPLMGF